MSVEFGSTKQLEDLERKLNELARTGLKQTVMDAIDKELDPLPAAVKQSALAILPKHGGLNRRVAGLVIQKQKTTNGVRVFAVGQTRIHDLVLLDRGVVRHPVYADPKKTRKQWTWVSQTVARRFWSRPVKQRNDAITAAVRSALDELARKL